LPASTTASSPLSPSANDNKEAKDIKDVLKTFEKDVKTLNSFFVNRSLFIKIHMIYKKLIPTCSGAAFLVCHCHTVYISSLLLLWSDH
jgi:hypothetical protein